MRSVNDLQLMFLERIAIETPEATARLFELRDAGKWQAEYRVSADLLNQFLQTALEQEQEHVDWFVANKESIDRASEARPDDDEWMKRYHERKRRWTKDQRTLDAGGWPSCAEWR